MNSNPIPFRVWLGIDSLAKAGGGPTVVVQQLSEQLAAAGIKTTILTRSQPSGEPEAAPRGGHVHIIRLPRLEGLWKVRKLSSPTCPGLGVGSFKARIS